MYFRYANFLKSPKKIKVFIIEIKIYGLFTYTTDYRAVYISEFHVIASRRHHQRNWYDKIASHLIFGLRCGLNIHIIFFLLDITE